ncbi:PREDICTED: crossover junction endonuclease EME1-like [Priapulus caudatus]|uniref:Crossover junction endonuclease EME1-like n=1 Tax=Priapulus caudatus TaxID=37621 RepID=A0ABM1DRA7_PRICU|nr:PREDICTED: crossover junction endonuclease EME1-like [Priapulus caudatus]XP_014662479.1 PREDICTED: crossover junction endonuclease EME1-like [Priapulus caudatus]XP_014662480.1 PREDICTED: crossover junction endonuclease EME1-like [Priapulus caudatus]XP_014662481.1 PREDICTED: crossover junction endonuclease EME1-like [Priapulus caudatus]XP_014662483.1 PREDICTED: crossover junction endonuclease EME1-like [Priapulus caudatus]XP_014662484.1 PREDICTED: crossover junction endonuclease EME1-like [P
MSHLISDSDDSNGSLPSLPRDAAECRQGALAADDSSSSEEEQLTLAQRLRLKCDGKLPSSDSTLARRRDFEQLRRPLVSKTPSANPPCVIGDGAWGVAISDEGSALRTGASDLPNLPGSRSVTGSSSCDSQETCAVPLSQGSEGSITATQGGAAKRKRRSPEEVAEAKRLAQIKKQQREAEVQSRKEAKEREKALQHHKKVAECNSKKAMAPGECLKHVTAILDASMLEGDAGGFILQGLRDCEIRYRIESQTVPLCVTWVRDVWEHQVGDDLQLNKHGSEDRQREALVEIRLTKFLDLVVETTAVNSGTAGEGLSLGDHMTKISDVLHEMTVTFFVVGLKKYFREQKTKQQRGHKLAVLKSAGHDIDQKKRKKGGNMLPSVTETGVEGALVAAQIQNNCNFRMVETPLEVANLIATFTKAIAEAPFKREKSHTGFAFDARSESQGGVKVTKDGKGLQRVWLQQFQQFRKVSHQVAAAVHTVYPSPQQLLKAYKCCSSENEAQELLKDIIIRRGAGVIATSRRVGPELSKEMYRFFTARDGHMPTKR